MILRVCPVRCPVLTRRLVLSLSSYALCVWGGKSPYAATSIGLAVAKSRFRSRDSLPRMPLRVRPCGMRSWADLAYAATRALLLSRYSSRACSYDYAPTTTTVLAPTNYDSPTTHLRSAPTSTGTTPIPASPPRNGRTQLRCSHSHPEHGRPGRPPGPLPPSKWLRCCRK